VAELRVGIKADVSEARRVTRALKDIKREAGVASTSLAATGKAAKGTSVSLQTTVSASGQLATAQNLAAVANTRAATTLQAVSAAATKTSAAEAAATVQTNRLSAAFARLRAASAGIFAGPTAAAKRFGTQARTALGSVAGASTAAAGLGAAVAVAFGIGVKSAAEFEGTLAKITGLVGIAKNEVEAFKKPLFELAKATAKGPNELAEALFFVTSAGFKGQEALDVLEASAKAAAAGLGETKQVADAVTSAVNAYGIENLTAAQSTDILVATVREGKAEADSIAGALGQVLPAASELGVGFSELGGTIAALTRIGLGADQGATALGATLAAIQKPGDQAKKTLLKFGTSASELRKKIREDGLLASLQDLQERFGDNETALTEVFPNIRALRAILPLVGKNAGDVAGIFERVADSTGSTERAFAAVEETYQQKLKKGLVQLQVSLQEIGEVLLPAVTIAFTFLVDIIKDVADGITFLADVAKTSGEIVAEAFAGSDDPVIRNINNIRELRDELERLQDGGDARKFFTEVGGIELAGTRDEQIQQLEERLSLERVIEGQIGREELARQRANSALSETLELVQDINDETEETVVVIDEERQKKAQGTLESLREELSFLRAEAVNLQELGKDGIGLAEDFAITSKLARDLQGNVKEDAKAIRALINEKRQLTAEVEKINAAFQAQDAATSFLQDLIVATAALQGNFSAIAGGGSLIEVESFRQAQQIASDLNGELGLTVDEIQQIILQNKAWDTALKQLDSSGLKDLVAQRDALIAQQAAFNEGTQAYEDSAMAITALGNSIVDAALAAEGLDPLQKILDQTKDKETQFQEAGNRLREAFNAKGILDPDADPDFQAAIERLREKVFGLKDIFAEFSKQAAQNLQSNFSDFLFDPFSDGLDGMASKFADTLKRLASDLLANQILTSFFTSLSGLGGGIGGVATAALNGLGGQFAEGGNFSAGKPILVGEQGPEIITPRRSGSVIPNDMMGGAMAAPEVNVAGPTIVNTIDDGQIVEAFNRGGGGQVVLNDMTERKSSYRQALGIS